MSDLKAGFLSTEGITDPAARQVIKQLQDLLNIRQGYAGDGEKAFVTREQLRGFGMPVDRIIGNNTQAGTTIGDAGSVRARLEGLLGTNYGALEESINASPSFQLLGAPVKPLGGNGAQIVQLQTKLDNSFASFAQMSNTLQAQVGQQRVTVLQNTEAIADLDGNVKANWYVKIDNGGYVSGFGLFSTSLLGGPVASEFYIRADKFAIAAPGLPPRTILAGTPDKPATYAAPELAEVPFIVFSTPTVISGKTVQPGVYMRRTFIHDGAIVNAMIGAAAVNTLEIQGNAVTIPVIVDQGGSLTTSTSPQSLVSGSIVFDAGAIPTTLLLLVSMNVLVTDPGGGATFRVKLYVDGVEVANYGVRAATGSSMAPCFSKTLYSYGYSPGAHNIDVRVYTETAPTTPWSVQSANLLILGGKR